MTDWYNYSFKKWLYKILTDGSLCFPIAYFIWLAFSFTQIFSKLWSLEKNFKLAVSRKDFYEPWSSELFFYDSGHRVNWFLRSRKPTTVISSKYVLKSLIRRWYTQYPGCLRNKRLKNYIFTLSYRVFTSSNE